MTDRIKIRKLPFGDRTEEGSYYAQVDGQNIGVNGRAFWETKAAARVAAETFILGVEKNAFEVEPNEAILIKLTDELKYDKKVFI